MSDFLEYSEAEHCYYRNGRRIPSVTQILMGAGLISPFAMDESARWRGRMVHELTAKDDVITGPRVDLRKVPRMLRGYILAWRKYRLDSGFVPAAIEERIDCADHGGFAGRFDRVGVRPNNQNLFTIIDIKTGAVPKDYTGLQLAAYAHSYEPGRVWERIGVSLKPDGSYRCTVFPLADFETDKARWFRMVIEFHRANKGESNGHTE